MPVVWARRIGLVLEALALVLLVARVAEALPVDGFRFNVFTDRELVRALRWPDADLALGAELSGRSGARVPGWLVPLVFGLPTRLGLGPEAVYAVVLALALGSLVVLHLGLRPALGPLGAGVATVLVAGSAVWAEHVGVLYNPALVPMFAAICVVGLVRAVHGGDARWLAASGVAGVVGAQAHGSVAVLTLAALVAGAPWVRRWRGAWVGVPTAIAVTLPYVVADALGGLANTRALLDLGGDSTPSRVLLDPGAVVRALAGRDAWLVPTGTAAAGLALLGLAGPLRPTSWRVPGAVGLALGIAVVALARGVGGHVETRYALVLVPLLAAGLGGVVAAMPVRGLRVVVAAGLVAGGLAGLPPRVGGAGYRLLLTQIEELGGSGSIHDVAGGTTWSGGAGPSVPAWPLQVPADHLLAADGGYRGASRPPCNLVLPFSSGAEDPELASLVPSAGPAARVLERRELAGGVRWLRFDPDASWCPTTMRDCYVDRAEDVALRDRLRSAADGEVVAWREGAAHRFGVRVPSSRADVPLHLGVEVTPRPGGVDVRVHGPELRPWCDTPARHVVRVRDVAVELASGAEQARLPIAEGLGGDQPIPPVTAGLRGLAPGAWSVSLTLVRWPTPGEGGSADLPLATALGLVDVP